MFVYTLIRFLSSMLCAFFLQSSIGKLITISQNRLKRFWMFFSCFLLISMIIFLGDFRNILPTFIFFLVTVYSTCQGSFFQKTAIALLFSSTILAFNTLRDNCLIHSAIRLHDHLYSTAIFSVSSILFSLFLFLGIRSFAPEKNYELSDTMWKLLILLTVPPLGIVFVLVLLYDVSFWDTYSIRHPYFYYFHKDYTVLLIISIFSFIGLLWTIIVLARQQKLEQQNAFAEINNSYYKAMEQHDFEIRRLKHDMANHLQVLSALPEKEQRAYFNRLSENAALTQTFHYCGDATVNAVLSVKKDQMNRYGIHLVCTVDIPKELPFEKPDICALFANALDNALEACRKPDAETISNLEKEIENEKNREPEILLESKAQKGLFCLIVKNPVPESCSVIQYHGTDETPFPSTSKQNKQAHGLGLKSMQEIVMRYQGKMELKIENGYAELFLYMPLYDK